MAAETLAAAGVRVTVYERMPTPARKLLIAGGAGSISHTANPFTIFFRAIAAASNR